MKQQHGFTLIELLVTMAVLAILAALAVPNVISWRANTKLQNGSREVLYALQDARLQSIKTNAEVVVSFKKGGGTAGTYEVFIDNGNGGATAGNGTHEVGEPITNSGHMPAGVEIENDGSIAFTSRGYTKNFATLTVTVKNGRGSTYDIEVIGSGHTSIYRG